MAAQKIVGRDGTTTVIDNSYGFGALVIGGPEPADMTSDERAAARRADRIGHAALLKTFGWSDADLERARGMYSFPASIGRKAPLFGRWEVGEPLYSRAAIARWRDELLQFAGTLKAK